jgi:hypothetical protein
MNKYDVINSKDDQMLFVADAMNVMPDGSVHFFHRKIGDDLEIKSYEPIAVLASGCWKSVVKREEE